MTGKKKKQEQCAPKSKHIDADDPALHNSPETDDPNPTATIPKTLQGKGVGIPHSYPAHSADTTSSTASGPPASVVDGLDVEADFIDGSTKSTRVRQYEARLHQALEKLAPDDRDAILKHGPTLDKSNFARLFLHRHCCILGEHGERGIL